MKFATAINCIDGRVQKPVIKYITEHYNVDYIDMVTVPGANKVISDNTDKTIIENLRKRVEISVTKHKSESIAIVGHHDCAGNPVEESEQKRQIKDGMKVLESWDMKIPIIGLWVDQNWNVNELID